MHTCACGLPVASVEMRVRLLVLRSIAILICVNVAAIVSEFNLIQSTIEASVALQGHCLHCLLNADSVPGLEAKPLGMVFLVQS